MKHYTYPEYTVRKSKKAKSLQLSYTSQKGLEVVVPYRLEVNVEKFIYTHKDWVEKQIKKAPRKEKFFFPTELSLKFLERTYSIIKMPTSATCKIIERPDFSLVVMGNIEEDSFKKVIKEWLFNLAKDSLLTYLEKVSKEIGIDYKEAIIRKQSTIWGSCSKDKKISINYKLLFFSTEVVKYIFIHELCHIVYLNHSKKFWELVKEFDQKFEEHKKTLNSRNNGVSFWL